MDSFCPNGCYLIEEIDGMLYSRKIGIEVWGLYDGVCYWKCPDCGADWLRDGLPDRVGIWFEKTREERQAISQESK